MAWVGSYKTAVLGPFAVWVTPPRQGKRRKQRSIDRSTEEATTMALSISHQIGTLSGMPTPDRGAGEPVESTTVNVPSVWKSPLPQPCCGIRSTNRSRNDPLVTPIIGTCRRSPTLGGPNIRPGMGVACQALMSATEANGSASDSERAYQAMGREERGVPVYVMLPLDTVKPGIGLKRETAMNASMTALKTVGVEGVMVDVWWGIVEKERPEEYDWAGYTELFEMMKNHGLKVQAVMSFHHCGGNVGDSCTIPLPRWVVEEIDRDRDLAYTDQWGRRNPEYISLGCDALSVLRGRTPAQCYADFMQAFREQFCDMLGSTIVEVQVGMGPAGELRYPSYPEKDGTWRFPGIGAFQCYDKYMMSSLKAAAEKAGKPEWCGPPTDAGGYHSWPEDTAFFRHDGGWSGPYGDFFLSWYSMMLLNHGETILSSATSIFQDESVKISVKIAGIHWHYGTRSHAPELTAGYYNTRFRDGYLPIARMLGKYGATFNFTCVEMRDCEQPRDSRCMPEGLVRQAGLATEEAGVELAGENALPRYDAAAHDQIVKTAVVGSEGGGLGMMCGFTYLRMSSELFHPDNWRRFSAFVGRMRDGKGTGSADVRCLELVEMEAAPLVREAVVALMDG